MMNTLPADWLTAGLLDAEYQKYVILAYLQAVRQNFTADKLYPDLPALRQRYAEGQQFQQDKQRLTAAFPKPISRINPGPPPRIDYQPTPPDDGYLGDVDQLMGFVLPRFARLLTEGQARWDDVLGSVALAPVGLQPLRPDEGYLFLSVANQTDTHIYQFTITLFSDGEPGGRWVRLHLVETARRSLANTVENMKLSLLRRNRALPNPAAFMLETRHSYPVEETLLPAAKALLAKLV